MVAPSKSFTFIADGAIDPSSPITTELKTAERDNDINLQEWLGKNFTPTVDHDHDGLNSKAAALTVGAFSFASFFFPSKVLSAGAWSVSTGALGFDPVWIHASLTFEDTNPAPDRWYQTNGVANGTGVGDQNCSFWGFDDIGSVRSGASFEEFIFAIAQSSLNPAASDTASVSAFGSAAVTIASDTGAWVASSTADIWIWVAGVA